jgi:hypothetical protein
VSVYVTQYDPGTYAADLRRHGGGGFDFRVGRAMFETTALPAGWLAALTAMDEVWVPTHWGREVFLQVRTRMREKPYSDGKELRIVTFGISGGRSLTGPFRDARRFPSTRWYPVPEAR